MIIFWAISPSPTLASFPIGYQNSQHVQKHTVGIMGGADAATLLSLFQTVEERTRSTARHSGVPPPTPDISLLPPNTPLFKEFLKMRELA